MRAIRSSTDAHTNPYADSNSYIHPDTYADREPNTDGDTYSKAHADAMHWKMCTYTEAASYSRAAPVAFIRFAQAETRG